MAIALLSTKLYIPPIRPKLVPRPHLIERLDTGYHRKLTLISAPAGFGKTTLLSEWVHRRGGAQPAPSTPMAWLSLDADDNDPTRFWTYIIATLQTVHPNLGQAALAALQSPQPPPIESLLSNLINEIAEIPQPLHLILDDFHLITSPQINQALAFLVDNMPPQMHIVLASRADPPWPLARLRARREMVELRASDLRFTLQETNAFLNDVMGLGLAPEPITALEARTEGWIAGLQLAALSIQGQDVTTFTQAFGGSHRFILDYLVEEVLDRQTADVQAFLLRTSILQRLTAPLCDLLTERDDSQTILSYLENGNLFLLPLDDERRWYRYHRLFADLLRSRLEQIQSDLVPALHRRASQWHGEKGLITEAVSHALAAGDVEQVVRWVEGNALAMLDHGELTTLKGWLDALPDQVTRSRPWLCIACAWTSLYTGRLADVESLLHAAEQALKGLDQAQSAKARRITGHLLAIRAYHTAFLDDFERTIQLCRQALNYIPEKDLATRVFTTGLLAAMLRRTGDLEGAAQAQNQAITLSQATGNSHVAIVARCNLAILESMRGNYHKEAAIYQQVLKETEHHARQAGGIRAPAVALAYIGLGRLHREWNDLDSALYYTREGIKLCQQWGMADMLAGGYSELAQVLQTVGDPDGARQAIQDCLKLAYDTSSMFVAFVTAEQTQLQLAQGNLHAASRWAIESGLRFDDNFAFQHRARYVVLARVLIAQKELDQAVDLLGRLLSAIETAGAMSNTVEILVLQALALQAQGHVEQALDPLQRALTLAEPEGYVRTFIDEGEAMGRLLRQATARGIALDYARRLLSALEKETKEPGRTTESVAALVSFEPLSERETEVLRFLTTHLSNTEIANQLFISVHTVRSHVKNIYSKLNVHSRQEAVQRAEELGLL